MCHFFFFERTMFVSCPGHGQVIRFKMWDNSFGYNSAPAQAWGTSYNARSYALPTYRNSRLLGTSNGPPNEHKPTRNGLVGIRTFLLQMHCDDMRVPTLNQPSVKRHFDDLQLSKVLAVEVMQLARKSLTFSILSGKQLRSAGNRTEQKTSVFFQTIRCIIHLSYDLEYR